MGSRFLLMALVLAGPTSIARGQPLEPDPVINIEAEPRLDPVPPAIAPAVDALRRHVRRTNRCRYGFARTMELFPQSCVDELEIVSAARGEVLSHAVGLELVRSLMIPRGQRGRVRFHAIRWAQLLGRGEETSVRYLIRALSLLDQDSTNHDEIAHGVAVSLQRITHAPIEPFPPWEWADDFSNDDSPHRDRREPVRRAWIRWYAEHQDESVEEWRAAGLRAQRSNLESHDPVLRALAVYALYRAEVADRDEIARAQLASPHLFGRPRRWLHRSIVNVWRLLPWREASRITRDAMRERARLRAAAVPSE